ncbi:transcription antiterminator [Brevibacillus sp. MER 51]|uniref:BglG family transcription antiterminator n=1 Tax=Brevibacillus sp. MER 51 TaxID=2939560 RepID=UPI00203BCD26|nr:transcription antiterminator [Brevibacillus sp. MER 51]MCM3141110.1 transcription antiterminator [Brevibacillus sp. MER 51]
MVFLTTRSHSLLKVILDSYYPLKIKDVARDFQVSERTVKYDLENIRQWLKERNVILHSQPNKGLWITEEQEHRNALKENLQRDDSKTLILPQKDRVKHFLFILLLSDGYQRMNDLADHMGVSRNTVVADVKDAEKLLDGWRLELVTKQRYGVRVDGSERHKRYALENLIHDLLDGNDMYRMVQGMFLENGHEARTGPLLEKWLISRAELGEIIHSIKAWLNAAAETLTDRALISLLIRLCIVVHRVQRGQLVTADDAEMGEARHWIGYELFSHEVRALCQRLNVVIPEHEIAYACLPLLGTEQVPREARAGRIVLDVFQATKELTEAVSNRMLAPLYEDQELVRLLFAHLDDSLNRYRQGVLFANPLTEEIRRSYARMFDAVKRSCEEVFWHRGVYWLDADIAYFVLHFQAAYDRWLEQKKADALVVCGTGRGTSRFLKTYLESELRSLRVVGLCSSTEVEKYLASRRVDVIISVLPIKAEVPVVIVSPLPTRQDINQIQNCLEALQVEGGIREQAVNARKEAWFPTLTADLNPSDLPVVERLSQDVICKGYEISQKIVTAFREYLTEQMASGLTLHLLLMVNRLAFGSPYQEELESSAEAESIEWKAWRERLNRLMAEANLQVPPSEVTAIMRYFSGKGTVESESGSTHTQRTGH